MNRSDLQQLADLRLREARALLWSGNPCGAYYLAGYAVECALKACIARKTKEFDFPDRRRVNDAFVHSPEKLLMVAELKRIWTHNSPLIQYLTITGAWSKTGMKK